MDSTNPIPLYYPLPFVISTMFVHINASGMYPSRNTSCMTITTFPYVSVSRSSSLVAAHNHALSCFAFIPDGPHALTNRIFPTGFAVSSTSEGLSLMLTNCTKIGMIRPPEDVDCRVLPAGLRCDIDAHL